MLSACGERVADRFSYLRVVKMNDTILIVEDDPDIAECLQYSLEHAHLHTQIARTGEQGLSASLHAQHPPAVVLVDLHLPDVDGLEICRRLRADARTQFIPIIVLTAYASDAERALGFQSGADTYISKPYSMREVVATIRVALSRAHPGDLDSMPT